MSQAYQTEYGERETLRTSPKRANSLQKDSRRRTRVWDTTLSIENDHRTAHVQYQEEQDSFDIVVSGREFDQPLTDYEPKVWDKLAQTVLTLHENAHILYTDFDDLSDRIEQRPNEYEGAYSTFHNVFEDGRIEVLIREKYETYSTHFLHFNANLMTTNLVSKDEDILDDENGGGFPNQNESETVSLAQAVKIGGLDRTTFNSGAYDKLIDPSNDEYQFATESDRDDFMSEIHPKLEDLSETVIYETDAVEANKQIFEFVDEIIDVIANGDKSGIDQMNQSDSGSGSSGPGGKPDDSGRSGKPQASDDQIPDDLDGGSSSEAGEMDEDENEGDSAGGNGDENDEETEDEMAGGGSGSVDENEDESGIEPSEIEADQDVAAEIEQEIEQESEPDSGGDESEDDDAFENAIESAGDGRLSQQTVEDVPNSGSIENRVLWHNKDRQAQRLDNYLDLKDEKATEIQTNQRHGSVNGSSLVRAYIGDTRKYKQNNSKIDAPEINLGLIIDRSGSMFPEERETAIKAAIQTVVALESYSYVNVLVLELYDDCVRRAKPLSASYENYGVAIAHDKKAGGTPLTNALALATERLEQESGENVENRILVVTDGEPDQAERYGNELQECKIPVAGISIRNDKNAAGAEYYHRHKVVPTDGSRLTSTLGNLLSGLTKYD